MTTDATSESVIVIGAGIIGIACAHYLSKAGFQVTVVDRGTIAGACSHANCGFICPSHVLPLTEPGAVRVGLKSLFNRNAPFRIKPQLDPALWNWMWQFARRCNTRQMLEAAQHLKAILDSSMDEYHGLLADEKLDCQWKEDGLLYVMQTERGMEAFGHTDQLLSQEFDVQAKRLTGDELLEFEPALKPNLAGAYFYPRDTSVRPDWLARTWSVRLRETGVNFLEHCDVQELVKSHQRIVGVKTSTGELKADQFVIATGAWSPQLSKQLECRIPVQPGKGYSVTMERPDPCPTHPMLFPEHKVGVTPFDDGYRLGSMMEFAGYDTSISQRRIDQLRRSAEPYLITPHTQATQETWYGWRPMTWDSLPIIGPVPKLENAFLATGHNMLGMSLATATGKLITEFIGRHTPHIDVQAFSPMRFHN